MLIPKAQLIKLEVLKCFYSKQNSTRFVYINLVQFLLTSQMSNTRKRTRGRDPPPPLQYGTAYESLV